MDLKELLASLAKFAKAASNLPNCSHQTDDPSEVLDENEVDVEDVLLDELEYESSFPEFASALRVAQESLYELIGTTILPAMRIPNDDGLVAQHEDIHDPLLWEEAADVCDRLVEQIEDYLQQEGDHLNTGKILSTSSKAFRETAASQWTQIQKNTRHDIPKPQEVYQIQIDNSRTTPFTPNMLLLISNKPNSIESFSSDWLTTALLPGHGYDTRWGELKKSTWNHPYQDRRFAPAVHYPHPYAAEIRSFPFIPAQFRVMDTISSSTPISKVPDDAWKAEWIDTPELLQQCVAQIARANVVAVDLEAHSHRSFAGITCLMQISIRDPDTNKIANYLVDVLKLPRPAIHQAFIGPFTNPNIVKVFHGADMDVQWLQRDFHLYVVNLFDTGRAARALKFPSASYAHLLTRYVEATDEGALSSSMVSNKQLGQLADWRVRPLPPELVRYAIADTHYLLDIYERIKYDLEHSDDCSIQDVVDTSRLISLIRYGPTPFDPDGYRKLLPRYRQHRRNRRLLRRANATGSNATGSESAEKEVLEDDDEGEDLVLKALWDWRDQTARDHDESVQYVCTDAQLLRIANCCRRNTASISISTSTMVTPEQIRSLFHPMPPLIANRLPDIIRVIENVQQMQLQNDSMALADARGEEDDMESEKEEDELGAAGVGEDDDVEEDEVMDPGEAVSSSAFFHPTTNKNSFIGNKAAADRLQRRGEMMSPVLGTKALYEQAGWMTPSSAVPVVRDDEDEEEDDDVGNVADWTTTDDDDDDEKADDRDDKPRKLLSVHPSNQQFKSTLAQSLDLGASTIQDEKGGNVPETASGQLLNRSMTPLSLDDETTKQVAARKSANRIKGDLESKKDAIPVVLGLVASSKGEDDDDDYDDDDLPTRGKKKISNSGGNEEMDEEFVIPRSIREIYMISNRNRRNKKAGSPTPEQGAMPTNEKEREELLQAEALLKERGDALAGYFNFDADTSAGKRARTKSGRESEESVPDPGIDVVSKEDDVAFMKEIGWIQSKEEAEGMLNQRARTRGAEIGGRSVGGDTGDDRARYDATALASNNPFFAGGPSREGGLFRQPHSSFVKPEQQLVRPSNKSGSSAKGKPKRRERPEKKENRTHAYRKR